MANHSDMKVGDVWKMSGLPDSAIRDHFDGTINKYFATWSMINGYKAKILETNLDERPNRIKFSLLHEYSLCLIPKNEIVWSVVTCNYFTDKEEVRPFKVSQKCCRPSIALCDSCKLEFASSMINKGKTYCRWTRIWT